MIMVDSIEMLETLKTDYLNMRFEVEFDKVDCDAFERYAVAEGDSRETAAALNIKVDRVYEAKSRITKRLRQLITQQVQDEG